MVSKNFLALACTKGKGFGTFFLSNSVIKTFPLARELASFNAEVELSDRHHITILYAQVLWEGSKLPINILENQAVSANFRSREY